MAEARSRERWDHTASVMALLANLHRDPRKSRVFRPEDFHPYRPRLQTKHPKVGIQVLKQLFIDPRPAGTR
jgi:hypothetical protein